MPGNVAVEGQIFDLLKQIVERRRRVAHDKAESLFAHWNIIEQILQLLILSLAIRHEAP